MKNSDKWELRMWFGIVLIAQPESEGWVRTALVVLVIVSFLLSNWLSFVGD